MRTERPVAAEIQAIAFDVNGTLIDILTDDHQEANFRAVGHFLTYQGIDVRREPLRQRYFELVKAQRSASAERYPEFDAVAVWRQIIDEHTSAFTRDLPADKVGALPLFLAELYRGVSRRRLKRYPGVRSVLTALHGRMPMAIVSDAQSAWARPELHKVGLLPFFDPVVVSGDHGFRKPDPRLFHLATEALGVAPAHTLFVGNDMYRDIHGAQRAGLQTVMFETEHGAKHYRDTEPDFRITGFTELLELLRVNLA